MVIWQVILAAGKSQRMGEPKVLMNVGGEVALQRVYATGSRGGCVGAVVVMGQRPLMGEVEKAIAAFPPMGESPKPLAILNPRATEGMTTSVQAGLAALGDRVDGALIHPVDVPWVTVETVRALVVAARETPSGTLFVPTHGGRRGHPILLPRSAFEAVFALRSPEPLHQVTRLPRCRGSRAPNPGPGSRHSRESQYPRGRGQSLE